MRYLKYFEGVSKLWKYLNQDQLEKFINDHKQITISEFDYRRVIDLFNKKDILEYDSTKIYISPKKGFVPGIKWNLNSKYWLYFFEDEYFMLVLKGNGKYLPPNSSVKIIPDNYFLIDGWDGLEIVVSEIFN